jgi:RHS repeat-associated protein
MKIIRSDGYTVEEYSHDPWGNPRNPNDCSFDNVNTNFLIGRGFTGHEMLPEFQLINMNGRMYDPVIGRVLSPDNYVQNPENAQNYNKYQYCLNNPLKYTDPTGWLYDGYTIDINGRIEWIDYTGGDDYDVLYNKYEYYNHPEKRGYYDYTGERHNIGIRIDDKSLLPALVKASEYKQQAYPDINAKMAWKNGRWETVEETKTMLPSYYGKTNSSFDAKNLFRFAASNSTVEWSIAGFKNKEWLVGTLRQGSQTMSIWNVAGYSFDNIIYKAHSHGGKEPSYDFVPSSNDFQNARTLRNINPIVESWLFMPQNPNKKWQLLK